jgi:hypothetical protein
LGPKEKKLNEEADILNDVKTEGDEYDNYMDVIVE